MRRFEEVSLTAFLERAQVHQDFWIEADSRCMLECEITERGPDHIRFWVENGAWSGTIRRDGTLEVHYSEAIYPLDRTLFLGPPPPQPTQPAETATDEIPY